MTTQSIGIPGNRQPGSQAIVEYPLRRLEGKPLAFTAQESDKRTFSAGRRRPLDPQDMPRSRTLLLPTTRGVELNALRPSRQLTRSSRHRLPPNQDLRPVRRHQTGSLYKETNSNNNSRSRRSNSSPSHSPLNHALSRRRPRASFSTSPRRFKRHSRTPKLRPDTAFLRRGLSSWSRAWCDRCCEGLSARP